MSRHNVRNPSIMSWFHQQKHFCITFEVMITKKWLKFSLWLLLLKLFAAKSHWSKSIRFTWLDKKKTTKHSKIRAHNAMLHFSPCTPSYIFIFKLIIERCIIKSGGETKTNLFAEVTTISYQLKVASSWNGE